MNFWEIVALCIFLYCLGVYLLILFMMGASERRHEHHRDGDHHMMGASKRRVKDHRK